MMPGSEFVRTGNGQWTKVPGSRLAESILHRSLSRELGLSLRAETINDGNGNFFPPATAAQRILAPQPQTAATAVTSIANNLGEASSSSSTIIASVVKEVDPAQDEYKLFTRPRRIMLPTMAADQAKAKIKAKVQVQAHTQGQTQVTVTATATTPTPAAATTVTVNVPSLPWSIDGKDKNLWAKGKATDVLPTISFAAANRAVMHKSAMKLERLFRYEAHLEKQKAINATVTTPATPVPAPVETEDSLPKYCPLNPDLPDEFKGMSVNQIFETCYKRLMAREEPKPEEGSQKDAEQVPDDDDDKKSVDSIISSEACSEDLPFISSANVYSMRKREIQRARKKQAAMNEQLGVVTSSSSGSSPGEDITLDAGEVSFASGNSDPGQGDETPLFTIRSKKQPIKIVDPKTLQRPDKPKSPKDLANDVEFLKRGLRVLSTGAELTSQSYQMFKEVGMDATILAQTSEWCRYIHEFVKTTGVTLQNLDNLKKAHMRSAIFEQVGQCMGHKKKMDNSILGWTNFAISMFPVETPSDGKESPPESTGGVRLDGATPPTKPASKVTHMHNKACQDLNHELQKLTEDNKLKFKTLLRMLIDSLSECKDWIIKAPSYAKAKPLRYTELKPLEGLLVPSIEVEAPGETKRGKQIEVVIKQETTEHIHVSVNENVGKRTVVQDVEMKEHTEPVLSAELNQQAFYHAQQALSWYQPGFMMHGYGQQQGRPSGDYMQHNGNQVLRPRSAANQQMNNDVYQQGQHHGNYQPELTSRQLHRNQHNISRGRQGTRSGVQSRQPSTVGTHQNYGNGHPASHGGPQFSTYASTPNNEYLYNPEASGYQDLRYPYNHNQPQGSHQQPVLQHPQPWRTITTNDSPYLEPGHPQQFSQASANPRSTPDTAVTSGEYMRQDRPITHAVPQPLQRSMTVTPQIMPHSGIIHNHHGGNEQYGGNHGMTFPQGGGGGLYSGYGHTGWHSHNGHPMQQSQQQAAQGRPNKNVMYQQYGHHQGQYR
ncbi:hypothetical protein TWF506_004592 [Arthrobotrys conoides]|uniref:Uncharacterized protein n=1 Tax=Arthrobotrys conoides TaxID=74498 RepID=A0AAN8N668_9PEZI